MTLIDSRPGIAAVMRQLSAETGVFIDVDLVVTRLGPPLDLELAHWFPADQVAAMADRFRAIYPSLAIEPVPLLPGAAEAVAAVHESGGQSVVITAKFAPNAQLHMDHLGVAPAAVEGWRFGEGKTAALREHGATVYVGDHEADMVSAKAAQALAVGVVSGAHTADELWAAGADVVLSSLTEFAPWYAEHLLELRLADLHERLAALGSVVIAFSGGADSAFLLAAAVRALGPYHVVAATAVSASLPASELAAASAFAVELGVRHVTPRTYEMARDGYRANAGDRCYFCKAELLDVLRPAAAVLAVEHVATGSNADDAQSGFRPGMRAAAERGALTPLLDAGLTKAQIRLASQRWGLRTWDKPAAACLSSRIAYGIEITRERLVRVDQAEAGVRSALAAEGVAVRNLRVRDLGDVARVEVDAPFVEAAASSAGVLAAVRAAGFDQVEVDPRGFRSGSMNELLADPQQYR